MVGTMSKFARRFAVGAFVGLLAAECFVAERGPMAHRRPDRNAAWHSYEDDAFRAIYVQWFVAGFGLLATTLGGVKIGPGGRMVVKCAVAGATIAFAATLLVAYFRDEQPFNGRKDAVDRTATIRIGRFAVPLCAVVGGALGAAIGGRLQAAGLRKTGLRGPIP